MGLSIGMALDGNIHFLFSKIDFLILACNQLLNHLDKIQKMSKKQFKPKVIIRTSIGSKKPLNGGPQHTQDYTKIFKSVLSEVETVYLDDANKIYSQFKRMINPKIKKSFLVIENGDFYNEK